MPSSSPETMPLFYFDLSVNGQPLADPHGLRLAELREARLEAAIALAEMMAEAIRESDIRAMDITIRDAARKPLARISIKVTEDLC